MNALLWKDYRQNRPLLIVAAVLFALPYVAVSVSKILHPLLFPEASPGVGVTVPWHFALMGASHASVMTSSLAFALLAGCAIAGERSDRSAEFLAGLPVSRFAILKSKVLLVAGACFGLWLINFLVTCVWMWTEINAATKAGHPAPGYLLTAFWGCTVTALLTFGIAWLFSSLLSNHAIAAGLGIAAPMILGGLMWLWAWIIDPNFWTQREARFEMWYLVAAFALGPLAFVAGSVHYLKTTKP